MVIMADHGMADTEGLVGTKITNFIDGDVIEKACDSGFFMHFALKDQSVTDEVG